ncbi:SusD family outer membrane lipoprotein NanU [Niabella insulamsoli]|uniref:SusD family outer membrane lipoprotein NanU n=1 Tax=Niabella insulamsoli TaxID=3144874 RepID=UPI0031FD32DC
MKSRSTLYWLLCGFIIAASACSHKLDLSPVSSISDNNYWQTPEQVDAFVAGVHIAFRNNTSAFQYLGEMRADIFGTDPGSSSAFTGEATQGVERLWTNTLDMDNAGVNNFGNFYFNINQINLLIEKLNSINMVSDATRQYYLGVAYGMRAYYYFHLYRSWGDVIIQTTPTSSIDISALAKPASSADSVMQLIKSDIEHSLSSYGNDYSFKNQKSYWSKPATLMLKAEVYLWTSYRGGGSADATAALNVLNEIQTNVPSLRLLPDFSNVFASGNKGNDEMIFVIRNQLNESTLPFASTFFAQTSNLSNFYDSTENRKFSVTTDNWGGLLRAPVEIASFRRFKDSDSRKRASIQPGYTRVNNNYQIAGAFVSKFKGEQNAGVRAYTNDYPIYRYADLLLLKAEAKIMLGQDPANEINLVRQRAYGAGYVPVVNGYPNQPVDSNPLEAILMERYLEFIFEGKRWYDLRRAGDNYVFKYTNILPSESYKLLWPIDRNTLTNNTALRQTPGYPVF